MKADGAKADSFHSEAKPTARFEDLTVEDTSTFGGPSEEDLIDWIAEDLLSIYGGNEITDSRGASGRDKEVVGRVAEGPGCRCTAHEVILPRRAGAAGGRCGTSR